MTRRLAGAAGLSESDIVDSCASPRPGTANVEHAEAHDGNQTARRIRVTRPLPEARVCPRLNLWKYEMVS